MQSDNYWARTLRRRLTRRRALAATGGGAAGAAFLAACGGDDEPSGSTSPAATQPASTGTSTGATGATGATGLVLPLQDETESVKRGGTYTTHTTTLGPNLDPRQVGAQETYLAYSGLLHTQEGHMQYTSGELAGDIAESWEYSPDFLTLTMKITDKAHFTPIAPINGRAVDIDDVMFSWESFRDGGSRNAELVNAVNPDAAILSVERVDDSTIVINLAKPDVTVLPRLAGYQAGRWVIVPKEAADPNVLDLRNTQAGSGPWNLVEYEPSAHALYKANPGFGQDPRDVPYMAEIRYFIMSEYATILANFKNGSLLDGESVRAADLLPAKQDVPELEMRERRLSTTSPRAFFGRTEDNPFVDERVRTAWVMCINRDLFLDIFYNVNDLAQEGLPMKTFWDTALAANSFEGWWLDPQGPDFGENARFYEHNVEEAKKLLAAAGHEGGLDYKAYWPTEFGEVFYERVEAIVQMAEEAGFRPERVVLDWATEYNTEFRYNKGMFDGVAMALDPPINDVASNFFTHYHPNGAAFYNSDAKLEEIIGKMLVEFNNEARMALAHEFQRYEATQQYKPRIGSVTEFGLNWPAVRNIGVWQGDYLRQWTTNFIDPEKAPFA